MTDETMIIEIARTLGVRPQQVQAALSLLDEGNTIPFIARYRKEATGTLDEVQLRCIQEQYAYEQALSSRKETVRQSIEDQGCWNAELEEALNKARQLQEVEDIYLPYKPKKRTKASMACDAGLEPLARLFSEQNPKGPAPEDAAKAFLNDDVPTIEDAIQGAANILAERFSERADYRQKLRRSLWQEARLTCSLQVEEKDAGPMLTYADFSERITRLPSYRVLAINRGENEKKLKVSLKEPSDKHIDMLCRLVIKGHSPYEDIIRNAAADSYKRLIFPQMDREIRNELTAQAEKQAIDVFAENLRHLLLQPPFEGQIILGLDPGFRTGCKAAVISATGRVLDYGTYYLTHSEAQKKKSAKDLANMIRRHGVTLISIGNGTASYETEQFVSQLIENYKLNCRYVITNEAGGFGLLGVGTSSGRTARPGRHHPRCRIHRPPHPGSLGRIGQNRSLLHRRRPVSARRQPKGPVVGPRSDRHVGRQLRRRRFEYGFGSPAPAHRRSYGVDSWEYRYLPKRKRSL